MLKGVQKMLKYRFSHNLLLVLNTTVILFTSLLLVGCGNSFVNLKNSGRDMSMQEDIAVPECKPKPHNPNTLSKPGQKDGTSSSIGFGGGSTPSGGSKTETTPGGDKTDTKSDATPKDSYDSDTVKV